MTTANFTFGGYVRTMRQLLSRPQVFFSTEPLDRGVKRPVLMLAVSSAIYAVACLASRLPDDPLTWGGMLFINALGMALITALWGFGALLATRWKRVRFGPFFSVYALSNSAALLLAWIPFAGWIAELFKWWLIGTGLTRSCGLRIWHAAIIIGLSVIGVMVMFQGILSILGSGPL